MSMVLSVKMESTRVNLSTPVVTTRYRNYLGTAVVIVTTARWLALFNQPLIVTTHIFPFEGTTFYFYLGSSLAIYCSYSRYSDDQLIIVTHWTELSTTTKHYGMDIFSYQKRVMKAKIDPLLESGARYFAVCIVYFPEIFVFRYFFFFLLWSGG